LTNVTIKYDVLPIEDRVLCCFVDSHEQVCWQTDNNE